MNAIADVSPGRAVKILPDLGKGGEELREADKVLAALSPSFMIHFAFGTSKKRVEVGVKLNSIF